ncbi:hypothetical protein J5U23_01865 [Saccharolobus shibatae B12]|uniref:Holliday junction resolvase-related domain-containing protein n=1 Tax=Saccharolobus shibatae (strain ATCC 51178 / DSM 5389 / JCM 8931 / NBRC 15437 / B12) TaxID=523848 RepID=A0A8F5GTN4_SACSH|nr:Holliday junction resolvase-like protein [Saccharolobus shibatae]QXJ28996.1 hypothetical protein J5U23_01865 [Saccharolobus shibatae B12]
MVSVLDILLIFVLIMIIVYYARKVSKLNKQIVDLKTKAQEMGQQTFNQWVQQYSQQLRQQMEEAIKKEYDAKLEQWKQQNEDTIRKDAIQRSINTLLGRIGEEFAPLLIAERYNVNPKDFRHLGTPVDYIAFKGLSDDQNIDPEIIFFEIKSGKSTSLTERERKVRDAIKNLKVRYEVISLHDIISEVQRKLNEEINNK